MKLNEEQALRLWRAALAADGNSTSMANSAGAKYVMPVELDNALKSLRKAVEILEQLRAELER